ncbi:hypothetical protein LZ32DRAFT_353201 [Colletotrichum eremochloae]|nr:hypothetical protein LZ32DRAFT_353201 [Colletotrichum eremochloae]
MKEGKLTSQQHPKPARGYSNACLGIVCKVVSVSTEKSKTRWSFGGILSFSSHLLLAFFFFFFLFSVFLEVTRMANGREEPQEYVPYCRLSLRHALCPYEDTYRYRYRLPKYLPR